MEKKAAAQTASMTAIRNIEERLAARERAAAESTAKLEASEKAENVKEESRAGEVAEVNEINLESTSTSVLETGKEKEGTAGEEGADEEISAIEDRSIETSMEIATIPAVGEPLQVIVEEALEPENKSFLIEEVKGNEIEMKDEVDISESHQTAEDSDLEQHAPSLPPQQQGLELSKGIPFENLDIDRGGDSKKPEEQDTEELKVSAARLELGKQREDIAALIAHAQEGMFFIKQSIDVPDTLRGFAITPRGVPVRDYGIKQELLLKGRSTLRDRCVRAFLLSKVCLF